MNDKTPIEIVLLTDGAHPPTRGSDEAAGYDLYASVPVTIAPGLRAIVATDVAMEIPSGYYGRVAPRSGLSVHHNIDIAAGVIDSDYRGAISVVMCNNSSDTFEVRPGDRIAQLIITKITTRPLKIVKQLRDTRRGEGAYGSTGLV